MLNIFVLEDDFFQQTRIETAIKKCMSDNEMRYRYLEVFGKPQQLLDAIKETGNHQFFFLDIEIKGDKKRGMEIAREIREKDPSGVDCLCDDSLRIYASHLQLPCICFGLYRQRVK